MFPFSVVTLSCCSFLELKFYLRGKNRLVQIVCQQVYKTTTNYTLKKYLLNVVWPNFCQFFLIVDKINVRWQSYISFFCRNIKADESIWVMCNLIHCIMELFNLRKRKKISGGKANAQKVTVNNLKATQLMKRKTCPVLAYSYLKQ